MAVRLYILPVVHLTNPAYNVPRYLPHRFSPALAGLEGVPWAWTTCLLEDIGIAIADTTDVQNALLDSQPGVFPVPALDSAISSTPIRNRIRANLEDSFIPGAWINTGMVYRNILRSVAGMIEYHNRIVSMTQGRIFSGSINLSTTVSQLATNQQAALSQAAEDLGIVYSATGSTTLRSVILLANNLYNAGRPYEIGGAGLSMVI